MNTVVSPLRQQFNIDITQYESPWASIGFAWTDGFNIVWGLIEGFMKNTKQNKNRFNCGDHFYNFRKRMIDLYYSGIDVGDAKFAMKSLYLSMQRIDDIVINCGNTGLDMAKQVPDMFSEDNLANWWDSFSTQVVL